MNETDFREHYTANFSHCNYPYEGFAYGYRYGYSMAQDARYRARDWADIEADVQAVWEADNPSTWNHFKDAIRFGWEKGQSQPD